MNSFLHIDRLREAFDPDSNFMRALARRFLGVNTRIRIYSKLAAMILNGKKLNEAIEDLATRASRRGASDIEAVALRDVLQSVQRGRLFADAIAPYAGSGELMLIRAGEAGGRLPESFGLCINLIESTTRMKKIIKNALKEPLILFAAMIAVLWYVSQSVVPSLTLAFAPSHWKGITYSLYVFSQFVASGWILLPIVLIALLFVGIGGTLPYFTGDIRRVFDRVPPWSFYRLLHGSGWLLSLAALVQSGQTVIEANRMMLQDAKPWLLERLESTIFQLNGGKNLGNALEATGFGFPDREVVDDLVSYADLPNFDETLQRIGSEWSEKGVEYVEKQAAVLKSAAWITMAGAMMWIATAIMLLQTQMASYFSSLSTF